MTQNRHYYYFLYCLTTVSLPGLPSLASLDDLLYNMQALGTKTSVWGKQWWRRGWCQIGGGVRSAQVIHTDRGAPTFQKWVMGACPRYFSWSRRNTQLSMPAANQLMPKINDFSVLRVYFQLEDAFSSCLVKPSSITYTCISKIAFIFTSPNLISEPFWFHPF